MHSLVLLLLSGLFLSPSSGHAFGEASATGVLIGETREEPSVPTAGFAVIGDAGYWNSSTRQVRDSIHRASVRHLVLPGDNLYNPLSSYEAVWTPWRELGFLFQVVAFGNHHGGYDVEARYFDMPGAAYSQVYGQDLRFLVLNSNTKRDIEVQARWFEEQLQTAQETFVVPVFHHPPLTVSSLHGWQEREAFHRQIRPLILKYRDRITTLLVGHDHLAALYSIEGIPMILSGATHDTRDAETRNEVQEGLRLRTHWMFDEKPYWVRLRLPRGSKVTSELEADFIRATDDRLRCSVVLRTGAPAAPKANCAAE
jgi:hypothetical protein